jgi:hypothetical protein
MLGGIAYCYVEGLIDARVYEHELNYEVVLNKHASTTCE